MYWHMAPFGPEIPSWWLKWLKKGGVALIKALDHISIASSSSIGWIKAPYHPQECTNGSPTWALGGLLAVEPEPKATRHAKMISQVLLVI